VKVFDCVLILGRIAAANMSTRDPWPIIYHFNNCRSYFAGCGDAQLPLPLHRVNGIRDQIGPDMVELATARAYGWQVPVVIANDFNAIL
jgi:hypothetical protein